MWERLRKFHGQTHVSMLHQIEMIVFARSAVRSKAYNA